METIRIFQITFNNIDLQTIEGVFTQKYTGKLLVKLKNDQKLPVTSHYLQCCKACQFSAL